MIFGIDALNLNEELSAHVEPYLSAEMIGLLLTRVYSDTRASERHRGMLDEHELAMLN